MPKIQRYRLNKKCPPNVQPCLSGALVLHSEYLKIVEGLTHRLEYYKQLVAAYEAG